MMQLVTTLHIEKASHLRIGTVARRLRDIRSITIYNLFQKNSDTDDIILDEDIATQSLPFLSNTFPHLERIAFWGKCGDDLLSLNTVLIDDEQRGYISNLLDSFSGAFSCRAIPKCLQIVGLSCPNNRVDIDGSCQTCKRVCNKFPLEITGDIDLCLSFAKSNEIIMSREGGMDYIHSETRFKQLLSKSHVSSSHNDFCIIGHDYEVRSELTRMVELSEVKIKKLNIEEVAKAIKKRHPNNSIYYLTGDSFDLLKSIGILIDDDKLDPMAVRVENLDRMARSVMEESDSLFSPVDGLKNIGELLAKYHSTDAQIQAVIDALNDTGIRHLVGLLDHPSVGVVMAALRVVMYIVTGNESQTQLIIDNNALPSLLTLLSSSNEDIRKGICFSISNMTAGTVEQNQAVIDCDIIPKVISLLKDDSLAVYKEPAWVLGNCTTNGSSEQVKYLMNQGYIQPLFDLLVVVQDDCTVVKVILETLDNVSKVRIEDTDGESHIKSILDANDRRRMIEELQYHDDGKFVFSFSLFSFAVVIVNIYHPLFAIDVVRELSTSIVKMHFSSE